MRPWLHLPLALAVFSLTAACDGAPAGGPVDGADGVDDAELDADSGAGDGSDADAGPTGPVCEPGQVRGVGETCLAVGPEVCAPGFIRDGLCQPTPGDCPGARPDIEDGCVAVGIQGCAGIFLGEDGSCRPDAASCPAGSIVELGSGCVPVGIPGCAASLIGESGLCELHEAGCDGSAIPAASEVCLEVGIAGCAAAFVDAAGRCVPSSAACPEAGTWPLPTLGCASLDEKGCGDGPWGSAGSLAGLFVDPSASAAGATGTKGAPFASIGAAMASAAPGARVILASGVYDEPLLITKDDLEVVGSCASAVHITGTYKLASFGQNVGAYVHATGVLIRNLTVDSAGIGLLVDEDSDLELDRVRVVDAVGTGVLVNGPGSALTASRLVVEGTHATPAGALGRGLEVSYAAVVVSDSVIRDNVDVGALVGLPGTSLTLARTLVEGTAADATTGFFGRGLSIQGAAQVTLVDSAVVGNRDAAIGIFGPGSHVTVQRTVLADTLARLADQADGEGLRVGDSATASVQRSVILRNHTGGVVVEGFGASAQVVESLIAESAPRPSDQALGRGVIVAGGAEVTVQGCAILDNHEAGIDVSDPGTALTAQDNTIADTVTSPALDVGFGVIVRSGATATLARNAIVRSLSAGVEVAQSGSSATLTDNLVAGTRPAPTSVLGAGISVSQGASASATGNAVVDTEGVGVLLLSPGTLLDATANLVAGSVSADPLDEEELSGGVSVSTGAHATLAGNTIRDNQMFGVNVAGSGSLVSATANLVAGTRTVQLESWTGFGVWAIGAGEILLAGNAIVDNESYGVFASGSVVDASGNLIEGTRMVDAGYVAAAGIYGIDQASISLSSNLVDDNDMAGVMVTDPGTTLTSAGDLISGSRPVEVLGEPPAIFGTGLVVLESATATVDGTSVSGNSMVGVVAGGGDPGPQLVATRLLVFGTLPVAGTAGYGFGVQVTDGTDLTLTDSVISHSTGGGLLVDGAGTTASVSRTLILNTMKEAGGLAERGYGASVQKTAVLDLERSLIRGSSVSGFFAWQGTAHLTDVVVEDVAWGAFSSVTASAGIEAADGLHIVHSSELTLTGSRVSAGERAGILIDQSSAGLSAYECSGNQFGLAISASPDVTWDDGALLDDNETPLLTDGALSVATEPFEVAGTPEADAP